MKVYKLDKVACLKHIAAEQNISLSYRSRSEEGRLADAQRKQKQRQKTLAPDKTAQFGPPDKLSNFAPSSSINDGSESITIDGHPSTPAGSSRKRKVAPNNLDSSEKRRAVEVGNTTLDLVPGHDPSAIGRRVKMLFDVDDDTEWYKGVIATYNIVSGKYGIFFPADNETIETTLDDEDLEFID